MLCLNPFFLGRMLERLKTGHSHYSFKTYIPFHIYNQTRSFHVWFLSRIRRWSHTYNHMPLTVTEGQGNTFSIVNFLFPLPSVKISMLPVLQWITIDVIPQLAIKGCLHSICYSIAANNTSPTKGEKTHILYCIVILSGLFGVCVCVLAWEWSFSNTRKSQWGDDCSQS